MLTSVLPFTPEEAAAVTDYCTTHSNDTSPNAKELWDWTVAQFETSNKMSSPLQAATFKFLAELLKAERILEIGAYSGYSALAWHEATTKTWAQITTLELDPRMIAATKHTIQRFGLTERVTLLEGPAGESIPRLAGGTFDIIFIDANKDGYEGYLKQILDLRLLAPRGLILCDNIFARGMTLFPGTDRGLGKDQQYWSDCGRALDRFTKFCKEDPRIDTVLMPVYDGLTLIKWREESPY